MAWTYQNVTKQPEAWAILAQETLSPITIAVIDSGHDDSLSHHTDRIVCQRNFWNGTGVSAYGNNVDIATNITRNIQAGNGELYFAGDDRTGAGKIGKYSHGPWCASIAASNHAYGSVDGTAPYANLMLLRGFGDVGDHGDYWSLCSAIYWAVDNGANILSISTGEHWPASSNTPTGNTPALPGYPSGISRNTLRARHLAALQYAKDNGVLVIGGTGNSFDNVDGTSYFPNDAYVPDRSAGASFWVPADHNIWDVCVGGLCDNVASHLLTEESQYYNEVWYERAIDQPEYFSEVGSYHESGHIGSNYGSMCTVAVPSQNVQGSWGRNPVSPFNEMLGSASGISGATPQAAGCAANIWAINPNLTITEVASIINSTSTTDDIGFTLVPVGGRRINHEKAVLAAMLTTFQDYTGPLPIQTGTLEFYSEDDLGNRETINSRTYYSPGGLVLTIGNEPTGRILVRTAKYQEIITLRNT